MGEFADAYPSLGLCELIGVPLEDRDRFRDWANTIGLGFSPASLAERIRDIDEALTSSSPTRATLAARRRAEPRDDLVTRIAQAAAEDGGWTDFEVRGFIAGLVFAGHETTKNQLGWMVAVLAERPRRLGRGRPRHALARGRRRGGAAPSLRRRRRRPHRGRARRARRRAPRARYPSSSSRSGAPTTTSAVYRASRRGRARRRTASTRTSRSGTGPHFCLGAALARAELQEALAALTARLECPVLADGAAWKPPVGINGPDRLPIRFAARRP